ncbi:MAG: hypothetical protein ABIQ93_08090 [Saprospiraceae bacterium]
MYKLLLNLVFFAIPAFASAQFPPFYSELPPIPEAVTNNAVVAAVVNDMPYVYSFCGLDSTKLWSGIHLKAWRLNLLSNEWQSLPPVPDPAGGRIAAAASLLKGLIYVVGGYHVAENANESSSAKVHRFDPVANTWLTDAAPLPKAIDDQVQAVWRDSLLFVVAGWSNIQNVPYVQIYNPASDTWQTGTALPNNNNFKAFGASGLIVGDTLYYCGGAGNGANFAATSTLRKGYIHPDNPSTITWSSTTLAEARGYRMAAAVMAGHPVWVGGSAKTYNYDALAYDGSGGVPALTRLLDYDRNTGVLSAISDTLLLPPLMDLRGAAQISPNFFVTVGGMGKEQEVLNKVYGFHWAYTVTAQEPNAEVAVEVFPNPADEFLQVEAKEAISVSLSDLPGGVLLRQTGLGSVRLFTANLPAGLYFLHSATLGRLPSVRIIIIAHQ